MKKNKLSTKQMIAWISVNYGVFLLAFFTLGLMDTHRMAVIANFVLDVALCGVSLILNIALFSPRHRISMAGKIGLLFVTLCFAAFTCFAFLMPENGIPPVLFQ